MQRIIKMVEKGGRRIHNCMDITNEAHQKFRGE